MKDRRESPSQEKKLEIVGPAPSPVEPPIALPAPSRFRRHLPHYEGYGNPLFITFTTKNRWILPHEARSLVLKHILHDHMRKMELKLAIVMPDHVHMIYYPWKDAEETRYSKTEIVGAIKSTSAHSINKLLNRKGPVWQDEIFDHVTRWADSVEQKTQYVLDNPVRLGLCREPDEYPYLWRLWVEGRGMEE